MHVREQTVDALREVALYVREYLKKRSVLAAGTPRCSNDPETSRLAELDFSSRGRLRKISGNLSLKLPLDSLGA